MKLRRSLAIPIGPVAAILPVFAATTASSTVLYNSLVPSPGNLPSLGFEATQTAQFRQRDHAHPVGEGSDCRGDHGFVGLSNSRWHWQQLRDRAGFHVQ
jgi:hypothetical protein